MKDVMLYTISTDARGKALDGSKEYKLHLPLNIPDCKFWSIIVYDSQTKLIIHTDQPWPSVFSECTKLVINKDDSIDCWFGPKDPVGSKSNWVKTIPGKGWFLILRLYGIKEPDSEISWKPGEIEEINQSVPAKWKVKKYGLGIILSNYY